MSYYQRHLFICVNDRGEGAERPSCNRCGAERVLAHAKAKAQEMGITGAGRVRVQKSGCLDRCEEGPVCVVYPEGVWYTWVDEEDLDEIIESRLVNGVSVERLKI